MPGDAIKMVVNALEITPLLAKENIKRKLRYIAVKVGCICRWLKRNRDSRDIKGMVATIIIRKEKVWS